MFGHWGSRGIWGVSRGKQAGTDHEDSSKGSTPSHKDGPMPRQKTISLQEEMVHRQVQDFMVSMTGTADHHTFFMWIRLPCLPFRSAGGPPRVPRSFHTNAHTRLKTNPQRAVMQARLMSTQEGLLVKAEERLKRSEQKVAYLKQQRSFFPVRKGFSQERMIPCATHVQEGTVPCVCIYVHMCICICIYVQTYTPPVYVHAWSDLLSLLRCMHACKHACASVFFCACVCCVCGWVGGCGCGCVCVCVCVCV
jgi:hypothetical protein